VKFVEVNGHSDRIYLVLTKYLQNVGKECLLFVRGPISKFSSFASNLQRFDEERQFIQAAQARKLDDDLMHRMLYFAAFRASDSAEMATQQQWFAGKPEYEHEGLSLASATEGYFGRFGKARQLSTRAVQAAIGADNKEAGAGYLTDAAVQAGAFGDAARAREAAEAALKLAPTSQNVENEAALAFAMAGDTARAAP
jgi:hypothetical protein